MLQPFKSIQCIFSFEGTAPLRAYSDQAGTFWFIARDVWQLLEISIPQKALGRIAPSDKTSVGVSNPYGLHPHTVAISEQGLYDLTTNSRKPGSALFRARLVSHISPTLRGLPLTTLKALTL